MISWMRMPMAVTDSTDRPAWNGMMSSARVVEEKEGTSVFPHASTGGRIPQRRNYSRRGSREWKSFPGSGRIFLREKP